MICPRSLEDSVDIPGGQVFKIVAQKRKKQETYGKKK
jgi:hypothetical protein